MALTKDEIVKAEILNQAQKLFQQFGIRKTTMDEIAIACGKAKSTLYHYFKSKEEVFDAVIKLEMKKLRAIVQERVVGKSRVKDKLMCYFTEFHKEIRNKVNLYRVAKYEVINEAISQEHFKELMLFETAYITRFLEDAYDAGELSQFEKVDIPWFAEILIAGFFGIVRYSIASEEGIDQQKLEMSASLLILRIFD